MLPNRCIIIGGGSSIRQDWNTPVRENELWPWLAKEYTIGINSTYKWFEPTLTMFGDYHLYWHEKKQLDALPLVIGRLDNQFLNKLDMLGENVFLLKSIGRWYGKKSWEKGFYRGSLTGCFSLTFAYLLGFTEIYLLGYDFCEINGRTHFYQDEIDMGEKIHKNDKGITTLRWRGIGKHKDPRGHVVYKTGHYNSDPVEYFDPYTNIANEVKIFNVGLQSRIGTFPKISYQDFYEILRNENIEPNQKTWQDYTKNIVKSHIK